MYICQFCIPDYKRESVYLKMMNFINFFTLFVLFCIYLILIND